MLRECLALLITHFVMMYILAISCNQIFSQQPNCVSGSEFAIVLAAFKLLAVDVSPVINDSGGQMAVTGQLNFNLVKPFMAVFGFDIDNAKLIAKKFLIIVRIQYFHPNQGLHQFLPQKGIQKVN